jgi:hypothetical protein
LIGRRDPVKEKEDVMNLAMGNRNVIVGLGAIMAYLSMTLFIERTSALHRCHHKAAAVAK